MGLWKRLAKKRADPSEEAVNTGDPPTGPDPRETDQAAFVEIPERFTGVPEGHVVERLSWDEFRATGFDENLPDLSEVMKPKEFEKLWVEILRNPDGKIVAERHMGGERWWTPEEREEADQAMLEWEDQL